MLLRNVSKGANWKALAKRPELTHVDGLVFECSDEIGEVLLSEEPGCWEKADAVAPDVAPDVPEEPALPQAEEDIDDEEDEEEDED